MKRFRYALIFLTIFFITSSCLKRQFIEGRVEIVSSTDTTLNDSSLVVGSLSRVDWSGIEYYYENEFEIWIENSQLKTTNDTTGHYLIKTTPGIYTIKCQSSDNTWDRLIEEVKNIELSKNTKTEINFFIGYTVE